MTSRSADALPGPAASVPHGPLSVVHLIETLGSGGAERLLYTNLKNFPPARFAHTVMTIFAAPDRWAGPIGELGVRVESLACRGKRDLPAAVARLSSWLRKERPDLIHTHLWTANVVGRVAGRLTGIPVISSIHNPDYEPEAWNDGAPVSLTRRRLVRALDRETARFGCRRMIAVSAYVKESAHRHLDFPRERIDLLYNPIDVDELSVVTARAETRRELGLAPEAPLLLHVGRISPQKGLLYAIRALPMVLEEFPGASLISVGATDDRAWLAQLAAEAEAQGVAGRVRFLGARPDIPALLDACDLFLFPSLHEGLGIALVEAMAKGCACVATTTGPLPEVITHGIDGWLVPPGDERALAEAVIGLLRDPARRRELGERARESALRRFEPRQAAAELARIYESVWRESARSGAGSRPRPN